MRVQRPSPRVGDAGCVVGEAGAGDVSKAGGYPARHHAPPQLSKEEVRTAALVVARLKELGLEMKYANYQAILRFTRIGHAKILEEGFIPEGAPVADRDIVFGGGGEVALVGEVRLK